MQKYSELIKEAKNHPTLEGFIDFIKGKKAGGSWSIGNDSKIADHFTMQKTTPENPPTEKIEDWRACNYSNVNFSLGRDFLKFELLPGHADRPYILKNKTTGEHFGFLKHGVDILKLNKKTLAEFAFLEFLPWHKKRYISNDGGRNWYIVKVYNYMDDINQLTDKQLIELYNANI